MPQNWAEKIDLATGRPVEVAGARYEKEPYFVYPSGLGAHAWMPMSYSPKTGLVYIPAMHAPMTMVDDANYERHPGRWNTGTIMGSPPPPGREKDAAFQGWLIAWDPVKQQAAWKVEHPSAWNGGTLATAGNLVFQGDDRSQFRAYDARNGKELWRFDAGRGVLAGPITYRVNGEQYIAVLAGYGGSMGMARPAEWMPTPPPPGMLLVFKLGGKAALPAARALARRPYVTSDERFTPAQLAEGQRQFGAFCAICHGGPVNPDLFRSPAARQTQAWKAIVHEGALADNGMISFAPYLSEAQVEAIRGFVLTEAARRAAQTN